MSRLWLFLAVALPVLAATLAPMSSVDLTYQLRAGGEIIDTRAIPSVDTWTFTAAGVPWVDQQWGAQVLLAAVYRLGGWTGLVLLRDLLTAVVVGATLAIGLRRGLDPRVAAVLTLIAFVVAAPAMALRPQLFGMAFFALTLLLVVLRGEQPRGLWLVPLVVIPWSNVHGSFILAPVMLGLAWFEDLHDKDPGWRRTLLVGVLTVAAACLTPLGLGAAWTYAIGLSSNPGVTARTTEWQPTSLRDASGLLFFASVAAVVVLIARSGRRVPWPTLLWLGVFAAIGVVAQRGVAWWPFVGVATLSAGLLPLVPRPTADESRRINAVVAGFVILAVVALLPVWRPVDPKTGVPPLVLTDAPPGLTEAARSVVRPGDRVLNPQRWGSWFEFAIPEALVAVDSRIEMFPADRWADFEKVGAAIDGWQELLAGWGVRAAVIERSDQQLRDRLTASGWSTTYEDSDGWVLVSPAT
jgi:hypothetical protein